MNIINCYNALYRTTVLYSCAPHVSTSYDKDINKYKCYKLVVMCTDVRWQYKLWTDNVHSRYYRKVTNPGICMHVLVVTLPCVHID